MEDEKVTHGETTHCRERTKGMFPRQGERGKKYRKQEHANQPWSSKVNIRRFRSPRTSPSYGSKACAVPTDVRAAEAKGSRSARPCGHLAHEQLTPPEPTHWSPP